MGRWGGKQAAAAREGHPAPPSRALGVNVGALGGALVLAVVLLLVAVPGAIAAPPANDDFANAADLGAGLPVDTLTWGNVDATEEPGEPYEVFTVGHSVWFQWEATTGDVVTIDTCNSEFATRLMVFTGSSLGALTEVGRDNNSDGRFCPDAGGATFRPVAGTTYSIMVDGDGFGFPEGPAPVTQGTFELKIAETPSPANDNFADATPVETSSWEGEGKTFYSAGAAGFNWNATKEAGEPDHVGDSGGASVWYRWTAPKSGYTEIGACGSLTDTLLGLYVGSAVDALTPVVLESRPVSCFVNFAAVAGTTYRIAVDGRFDAGSGFPKMGGAGVSVLLTVPNPPVTIPPSQPHPSDVRAPSTTIRKRVLRGKPPKWLFIFSSNEPGSTFRCKLDKGRFRKCGSPRRVNPTAKERHVLRVAAVDKAGNVDPTPAVIRFGVAHGHHGRR